MQNKCNIKLTKNEDEFISDFISFIFESSEWNDAIQEQITDISYDEIRKSVTLLYDDMIDNFIIVKGKSLKDFSDSQKIKIKHLAIDEISKTSEKEYANAESDSQFFSRGGGGWRL